MRALGLLLLLGALASLCPAQTAAATREAGHPLAQYYGTRDYDAHHQFWTAVADRDGLLYFGNKGCVLEYDGHDWRKLTVGRTTFVRGLALAPDGTIYVGGVDELGYLANSPVSGRSFVSLRDQLPPEHRAFGDIWRMVATSQGVYFAAGTRLLRWRDGAFHVWRLAGDASAWIFQVNDDVYVHRRGEPLARVVGDALEPVSAAPFFLQNRIVALLPLGDGSLLACSTDAGLARLAPDGTASEFTTVADRWLRGQTLQTAALLPNGLIALGTVQSGALLLDQAGGFVRRIDESDGLRDPMVRAIVAASGQIWLCQNNGVTRLAPEFADTLFDREQGLDGTSVRAVTRHNGRIVAATGRGVFELTPAAAATLTNAKFTPVAGFEGRFYALLSTGPGLLAGENEGVQFVPATGGDMRYAYSGASVVALAESKLHPGRVWAATLAGVVTLDWHGDGWNVTPPPPSLRFEARSLAQMDDGTVWLGTFTRGLACARGMNADQARPAVEFVGPAQGIPADNGGVQVARAGDVLVVSCTNGAVLRYDPAERRFEPAPRREAVAPVLWLVGPAGNTARPVILEFDAQGAYAVRRFRPLLENTGPLQQAYTDADGTVWLAGADALGRHSAVAAAARVAAPDAVLRDAVVDGGRAWPANGPLAPGPHDVAFEFSAAAFAAAPEFGSWLEGYERGWSEFSGQRRREFSNLPAGRYAFHVRVRSGAEVSSDRVLFRFSIDAPWWSAWWVRVIEVALAASGMALLIRWRLGALQRRNQRLEQLVAARTAELRANEAQLRSARDAAEMANRAKSAFLAHMSHELRTPLNGILGYAQVMARDTTVDATNRERVRVIRDSGQHLLRLINEVLDLSKIEAGKVELQAAPCDLPRLVASVADIFRPRAAERGIAFDIALDPSLPRSVLVDEAKLAQVLVNLLGNAFKFTLAGRVTLRVVLAAPADAAQGPCTVHFAVEDTGIGIRTADLDRLFRPFVQVGPVDDRAQGTGLGLAISQRLVALFGGTLQVASEPGRGSRFWFDVALRVCDAVEPAIVAAAGGRVIGQEGPRRRVVVVDDNPVNRDVLVRLLEPVGFDVHAAATGAEALDLQAALRPDLILLDLRMQPMDGFTVAREVRARPGGAATRIIAVSASAFEFDRNDALRAGCDGFLPKPFAEDVLLAEIGRLLNVTWIREAVADRRVLTRPDPTVLSELRELASQGKVPRLRRRLTGLKSEDAANAEFYARIDGLAARFELQQIDSLLAP